MKKLIETHVISNVKVSIFEVPGKNYLEIQFESVKGFFVKFWRWDERFDRKVAMFVTAIK